MRMPNNTQKVNEVATQLKLLSGFCDTGFAVASHIRYTRPSLLYQTYSNEWIEHYSEKGYMLCDPVVHWGLTHTGWVNWDTLVSKDPEGVLAAARAHGLFNGWTYSVGPRTSRTITGHTRSGPPFSEAEFAQIEVIVNKIHDLTDGFEHFPTGIQDGLRALG